MIMWTFFGLLLLTNGILGAPVSSCPKSCSCAAREIYLEVHCKSFNGLKKSQLSPEQITAIVALDVNGSTTKANPDLSHLHHLKRLTLTSNKIQEIVVAHLPKSLEYLDLSKNFITHPPQALELLPALKEVNLFGNPISCSCASLAVRDILLERGVTVAKRVKCESPENLRGKEWLTTTCDQNVENLFGEMQGDAPYEGSGSGDVDLVTDNEPTEKGNKWDTSIEDEFIPVSTSSPSPVELTTAETEFEGSGDGNESTTEVVVLEEKQELSTVAPDYEDDDDEEENYDYLQTDEPEVTEPPAVTMDMSLLNRGVVKACNFNCSTPSPLGHSNDTDVLPAPGFKEAIEIVVNDIFGNAETTTTTTTTSTTTLTTTSTEAEKEKETITTDKNGTLTDAELIEDDLNVKDRKENIEEPAKQSNSTFIFLAVLLLVIICLVIYAIVKKRSINRSRQLQPNRPEEKEKIPEEVELIKKVNAETDKPNGTHETIPLMNGHNENQHKTAEEALPPDANDASKQGEEYEDVELRPKKAEQKNLLTPEAKRVTIKASEIPNSTPKTPILVTRHVNSDGSVVTTPNVDQNV
ncbi:hypothetical protein ILUMI_24264 [Ignelater luminosus]|uniref:Uncharacterized protein n=1 Tax=Ignelater luminosus TaxID=2038154 RepID=A0A8K0CAT9_IGNLU|nr:hypothetical protein ILUMI_24264 [Ignelater luminosus]